jgi:hypothetical protein
MAIDEPCRIECFRGAPNEIFYRHVKCQSIMRVNACSKQRRGPRFDRGQRPLLRVKMVPL